MAARFSMFGRIMQSERTKYNVDRSRERRTCDGIVFDSQMEMKYYRDVVLPLVRSGDITYFELQKQYELQPKFTHDGKAVRPIIYVADFYLEYKNGTNEVVDTKGFADSCARMKRKLFWYKYPGTAYRWICYSKMDGGWCDYDELQRRRKTRKKTAQHEMKENFYV